MHPGTPSQTLPPESFPKVPDRREGRLTALFVLGLVGSLILGLYLVPRPFALRLLGERGPMETVSLGFYAVAALRILRSPGFCAGSRGWALAALSLLVVFEVNPGGWIEDWVESPPAVPGGPGGLDVLGALAVSGSVLLVFGGLVRSGGSAFVRAVRVGAAEARLAVLGAAFLPVTFGIDLIQTTRFNWHRGYRLEKGAYFASHVAEESMEFLMPVLFLLAVLFWERRRRAAGRAET